MAAEEKQDERRRDARVATRQGPTAQRKDEGNTQMGRNKKEALEILYRLQNEQQESAGGRELTRAIRLLEARDEQEEQRTQGVQGQLDELKSQLSFLVQAQQERTAQKPTWAAIARKGVASQAQAARQQMQATANPTIRVRILNEDIKGMKPAGILPLVKQAIPRAIAVRPLASGAVEVTVASEEDKERALATKQNDILQVLKQGYHIEVLAVDLSILPARPSQEERERFARRIEGDNGRLGKLAIQDVRWLKEATPTPAKSKQGVAKTRGNLLITVASEDMRIAAVQQGVIMAAQLYESVRYFDYQAIIRQCFNCQQWGHAQKACRKHAKCGHCAGEHDSRQCKTKETQLCGNCGKKHKAWFRRECKVFQVYLSEVQGKRQALTEHSFCVRAAPRTTPTPPASTPRQEEPRREPLETDEFQVVQGKRRRRETTLAGSSQTVRKLAKPKGRVGRPTGLEKAGQDPKQPKLSQFKAQSEAPGTQASEPQVASLPNDTEMTNEE